MANACSAVAFLPTLALAVLPTPQLENLAPHANLQSRCDKASYILLYISATKTRTCLRFLL